MLRDETPRDVLVVTWQGGGAVPPALGLARMLAARGHRVRVLAPASFGARVEAAGCEHCPLPPSAELDTTRGRAVEDQWDTYLPSVFLSADVAVAVQAQLDASRTDVVVVDCLMRSAAWTVVAAGVPLVLLVHLSHRFHGTGSLSDEGEWGVAWQYDRVDAALAAVGRAPVGRVDSAMSVALASRSAAALVVQPREFDDWPDPPANVHHVGALTEEPPTPGADPTEGLWPAEDRRPLVVVSLGTTYMHQEDVLGRVLRALAGLDVRALLLTGHELRPDEVLAPPDARVLAHLPHSLLLPRAALVVTHGGMGTVVAALAAGVPTLCLPLGRDQTHNAHRVAELDAGLVLDRDAGVDEIRTAARALLGPSRQREAAWRLAQALRGYDPEHAADLVEASIVASQRRPA